jgi:hypothetical protein
MDRSLDGHQKRSGRDDEEKNCSGNQTPTLRLSGISAEIPSTRSRVHVVDMKLIRKRGCWILVSNRQFH